MPGSPTTKPLREPDALLAHRGVKAERKQQPKVVRDRFLNGPQVAPTVSTKAGEEAAHEVKSMFLASTKGLRLRELEAA